MPLNSFVYCWTDRATSKLYVGFHKGDEDDGYICSSKHMLAEYGNRPEDFSRQILAKGTYDDCRVFEIAVIKAMLAGNVPCYNLNAGGAILFTDEVRKRMSLKLKGKKITEEHKAAIRKWNAESRQPATEETREKIAEAKRGKKRKPFSDEWRANMSFSRSGKKKPEGFGAAVTARQLGTKRAPHTEEAKEKIRQANVGRKHAPETIEKLRSIKSNQSAETKAKISAAKKLWWAERRSQKCH